MVLVVLITQWVLSGLQATEPSIVPHLLNPGNAQKLVAAPGGHWAYARPRDAVDIGQDAATSTLSLGLPVGRLFCELRLTTLPMSTGTAGSLALSAATKLRRLPQAQFQATRKVARGVLRQGVRFHHLNNPAMARFVVQWFLVERGHAMILHLEAPAQFEGACAGRAEAIALSMKRVGS
jgi:hypothetical protein